MREVILKFGDINPYENANFIAQGTTYRNGREYTMNVYSCKIPALKRLVNIIKNLALTIMTAFLALISPGVRESWSKAIKGKETVAVLTDDNFDMSNLDPYLQIHGENDMKFYERCSEVVDKLRSQDCKVYCQEGHLDIIRNRKYDAQKFFCYALKKDASVLIDYVRELEQKLQLFQRQCKQLGPKSTELCAENGRNFQTLVKIFSELVEDEKNIIKEVFKEQNMACPF